LLIAALAAFGRIPARADSDPGNIEWQTVRHSSMVAFFPDGWEISNDEGSNEIHGISPLTDPGDRFREKVAIKVLELDPEETICDVADAVVENLNDRATEVDLLPRNWKTIGSNHGMMVKGSYNEGTDRRFIAILFVPVEQRVYKIEATGETADFGGLENLISAIFGSVFPFPVMIGQTYFHYAFVIQFPENWEISETIPGSAVGGISPKSSSRDPFRERITLRYDSLNDPTTFEKNVKNSFDLFLEKFPGAKEIARKSIPIAGTEGRVLDFRFGASPKEMFVRVIMVLQKNRQFTLFYMGQNPDFSKLSPTADQIFNTFASPDPVTTVDPAL
jgi:hypothetical protein